MHYQFIFILKFFSFDLAKEVWTPTLRYYSGYDKSELVSLSRSMLEIMILVVDAVHGVPEQVKASAKICNAIVEYF